MGIQVQNFNAGFISCSINRESHLADQQLIMCHAPCWVCVILGGSITSPSSRSSVDPESFSWLRTFGETQCFSAHTGHCHQQTAHCPNHMVAPDVRWGFAETETYHQGPTSLGSVMEERVQRVRLLFNPKTSAFPFFSHLALLFSSSFTCLGEPPFSGVQECSPLFTSVPFFFLTITEIKIAKGLN